MQLKPGTVADFDNSMAAAIEAAMAAEWQTVKGFPLSDTGKEDRHILFVAIARGVLGYLQANQNSVITSITLQDGAAAPVNYGVTALDLNVGP